MICDMCQAHSSDCTNYGYGLFFANKTKCYEPADKAWNITGIVCKSCTYRLEELIATQLLHMKSAISAIKMITLESNKNND